MKPLLKWLALVAIILLALMQFGCGRERSVQVGTSTARNA